MSRGEALRLPSPPLALGPAVQESWRGRMLGYLVLASTVPQTAARPPSCCFFLPPPPSSHRLQSPAEGLGDFSAFLGECEIFAPAVVSG